MDCKNASEAKKEWVGVNWTLFKSVLNWLLLSIKTNNLAIFY